MAMSLKDSRKGGKPIRLMCVEKDKEFDELKFMASFRGTIKDFPSSIDQLKERTKAIIKLLDHNLQLQKEELVLSSGVDTGKNKVMAETIQKLSTELDLYQYLYARLCRMEVLESFVATLRPQLSKVLFMEEYCTYLVSFCESSVKLAGEKFKIFRFSGKGKYPMKDYVTTDHLLLLHQSLQSASSLLSLFSLETTTWKTFIFENHSDGLTSPPANVIRRIRSLLSSIGILDSDHGETSQDDYWRLERAYQAGLYEAVGEFLEDPKGMLQKEFLSRLQGDLAALEKGKGKSTQAVSIAEELNQILKWASLHPESLSDSISSAVDTALFEKVEREREIEEEKNAPLSLFEAPAVEVDMSEVIYNHITWDNLNVNQEIGVGGFALVYEAELAGERVAVKKIRDEVKDAKTQLSNEVKVMSQLRSSYVVEMYGASFRPGQTIMVMEYLPRGSIFDVLNNPEERVSWKMKWKFAVEMAAGLNYIHTRQPPIVHRDLKTGNFLLSEGWRVKLCDFGLAIPIYPMPPPENCGTVRWTAPEINDSKVYTTKSDVYSYGIILWEVAAREIPWKEETNDSTIKRVARGDRPDVPPGTSAAYQMLMSECWSPQPEHRPSFASILDQLKLWGIIEWVESLQGEDNFEKIKIESEKLQKKAERQSQQRSELEERQVVADSKVRQYQRQKRDLRLEKDEIERKVRDATQKNSQIERQITINSAKISDIEKQIRTHENKAAENRQQIEEEREQELASITAEVNEVKKKLLEEEEAVKELTAKKEKLQVQKDALSRKLTAGAPNFRSLTPTGVRP